MTVHENQSKVNVIRPDQIQSFLKELHEILDNKNIDPEQLAYLTQLDPEEIKPFYFNAMDLNLEVLNKIIEALKIKVVIQLQIEDL